MRARWRILGVLVVAGLSRADAHQELYHNVEVDLVETAETGVVKMSFTVHAPELLVGFSEAADAMFDSRWLGGRTDEELERIVELARRYLAERFEVRVDGGDALHLGEEVAFEDFESMRRAAGMVLPPACFLAGLEMALPEGSRELQVEHAASSEKRLMLVVYRPKAFPVVTDVEPGSRAVVELQPVSEVAEEPERRAEKPERRAEEPERRAEKPGLVYALLILAALTGIGLLLARRLTVARRR